MPRGAFAAPRRGGYDRGVDTPAAGTGRLVLVATPIGNLGDITYRAVQTLREVDVVACEDTRHTAVLFRHYGIATPRIAYHEHNERQAAERVMRLIAEGRAVALVSDAGTPAISDPGFTLVQRAIAAGVPVTMAPGPAAFVMALVLSGLPVHSFTFRGFPPRRPGARRRFLAADRASPHTLIYYESPYRVRALVADARATFGDRRAALANDLTKLFETVHRGTLAEIEDILGAAEPRGEYVLVVAGADG
jgi:16S rRNA (cytidine1402-2'-O)-methyltransferase